MKKSETLVYENLEYDCYSRINLFKNLLDNLDESDCNLKNLGYEIVDSKILLDLIKLCFKGKKSSNINLKLINILSKEVNRYSEFEKYLRNKKYYVSCSIDYSFDNKKNSYVKIDNDKSKTCLNDFINETNLFRLIINNKTFNLNNKVDILNNNKINNINFNIKEIFKDMIDINMDEQHFEELNEIISLRKKVASLILTIEACNIILNLDLDDFVLRVDVKNLFHLFVVECSSNIINSEKKLNKYIDKIQELIKSYKSKTLEKEEDLYNIYSDIKLSENNQNLLDFYYKVYENTINFDDVNCISFLTFLKINCPNEKELIKIVDAKYKQFSTIYSEYLIYKTPYVNTDLCITFDQFAKMKYGIENISTGFSK